MEKLDVAKRINEMHGAMVRNTAKVACEVGRLLSEQKAIVGHGGWGNWVESNLDFSKATAKRYMEICRRKTEDESLNLSDLKVGELYAPKPLTEKEEKDRTEYLKNQDKERTRRRAAFASRKHNYKNPPKGSTYENQIICSKFEDVMPEMIENGMKETFDALICSIPYNNGKNYGDKNDDLKEYSDYLAMIEKYIRFSYELLRKSGRCIINFDEMTRKGMKGDRHHMLESDIIQIVKKTGLEFYEFEKIIWYKENSGSDWLTCWGSYCSPSSPKLRNKFETILIFSKQEHNLPNINNVEADITPEEFKAWTNNVWNIHPINTITPHPAAYVEEICDRLIKLYTWPGGLVGDFFCGSGTTCKSAQNNNRLFFGADQNPNFAQYSRDRLDMEKSELREKYAEFLGGKRKKIKNAKPKSNMAKTPKLVVSELDKNVTFEKKSA